ncbi:hypothetical protein [Alkalicoccus urumqiensis]|uniref:DUF4190 domain-containing protein n=1 Tax=Alkalicoccus urumqiensis TaxID=1548213 RepID=A0A2P6MIU3_ALKUR|nr:hypothetical protein [Alkalicoccus urumqiensis]PRO66163.1 hypothetical protein C6I21_05005 [Alkalicoccus urumqiensis]
MGGPSIKRRSTAAVLTLILGVMGLVFSILLGIPGAVIALGGLAAAFRARSDIRKGENGKGMMTAGFILNTLALLVTVVLVIITFG